MDSQTHWEKIYKEKAPDAVSWYRPHLETSLALIEKAFPSRSASIIDVGGGESTLVDDLLTRGYENITVLDIAHTAIEANRKRLGFGGSGLKTNIDIDGKQTTQIANGQAIRILLPPGKHNITASARKAKADLPIYDLVMEAGKEYWVRVDFSVKFFTYVRLYLEPAEKAQSESEKLEEVSLGDLSRN